MSSLDTAAVVVSLASARRLSPSLVLQPDRVQAFFNRAMNGSIASLIQAPPFGGKTTFLKQVLKQVEENKVYQNIYLIDVRTSIALDQFTSTISRMAKLDVSSLEDLSAKLEYSDSLLIIDNFDLVEGRFEILEAFKNSASKLRLIGSVSFLPEIPTDLAFEVTTFSYEGLTEAEVTELVSKLKPDFKDRATEAFASTLGNPQLLRLYLTSNDFESSKTEYWKSILARLSQSARMQIQKAALCKQRYRKSENYFLNQIAISEVIALKQTALVIDQDGPGEIKLTEKAKEYVVSTLKKDEQLQISRSMIEDLRPNTSALELEEELCWQLQNIGDLKAAAEVATTVVPRLYDKFRFRSLWELTDNIFIHLDPITWNWRRFALADSRKSLKELNEISENLSIPNSAWASLVLFTLSKAEDWTRLENELKAFYSRFDQIPVEAKLWSMLAEESMICVRDRDFKLALQLCDRMIGIAFETSVVPRFKVDALMATCILHSEAGRNHTAIQYIKRVEDLVKRERAHLETTAHYAIHINLLLCIGDFVGVRQVLNHAPKIDPQELAEVQHFQILGVRIGMLCVEGKFHEANQMCREVLPDTSTSQITPRAFRVYESILHSRITMGATLELLDLLKSFALSDGTSESSSKSFAKALLQALATTDRGQSGLAGLAPLKGELVVYDYLKAVTAVLEYEWINGNIVSHDVDFSEILNSFNAVEFPFAYHQICLYQAMLRLFRGEVRVDQEFELTKTFFTERKHQLFAMRAELVEVFRFLSSGLINAAENLLSEIQTKYSEVESPEDQGWLKVAKFSVASAGRNYDLAKREFASIDPSSSAARSPWFLRGRLSDELIRVESSEVISAQDNSLILNTTLLSLGRSSGPVLIKERPVLIKLLEALYVAYPSSLDKEEICKRVWAENYNPLVHDTRIYTSIRRLREILRSDLSFEDPIVAVNGSYRCAADVREAIKIVT